VYDFLFILTELFSLDLTVETLQVEICRHEQFLKEGGSLQSPIKGGRGRRPPSTVGWQKTRRIALSCGIRRYVLWISHKACVWQMDGRTELRLPRPC